MARGGYRPGAGRKPNPDKAPIRATPKLVDRRPAPQAPTIPAEAARPMDGRDLVSMLPQIAEILQHTARNRRGPAPRTKENSPFKLPWFPTSALPSGNMKRMAMDEMPVFADAAAGWINGSAFAAEGLVFLGYTYLAELAQRPEYRTMAETIADDATRRWIDFDVVGDEKKQKKERAKDPAGYDERMADPDERKKRVAQAGKTDRVKALKDDQERLEVRDRFYWASCFDSWMGRSHLYLQIGDADFDSVQGEMASDIGNSRDETSRTKVTPSTPLRYIKTVEPVWTYPLAYNATNPLAPDWYNPQQWYVMGRQIHISRLQTFVTRPVPDMLKPAYAFGGLPLSQLAKPYVDIWLDTRQSVADLIKSFSVMILQTDLSVQTQPGNATALLARVALFNMLRDNQGLFVTNKNTEDFKNVSAPISGLHELQAQAQEHMLSVSRIPAVKFTGIQPAGLNASSEGEIKVYDDTIEAYQKRGLNPNLTRVINFQMLSLWGEVDPEISHRWEQLRQLTDSEKADQAKKEAERDQVYVDMGAISPAEVRRKIIEDEDSPYAGLDPDDVPEPPMPEPGEGEVDEPAEPGSGAAAAGGPGGGQGGGANDAVLPFAEDEANFQESKHPRAPDGKFTSGAGGGSSSGGASTVAEIASLLTKKPIAGSNYRKALIKALASATISDEAKTKLASNLAISWAKTGANAYSKGDLETYKKIGNKLTTISKAYGGSAGLDLYEATKILAEAKKGEPPQVKQETPPKPAAAPAPVPKASPEDKEKAKKSTTLTMSLVPGSKPEISAGQPYKNAEATIKAFNDKWAGKTGLTDAQLDEKVADFKQMQTIVNSSAAEEKKHAAAIAAKAKEEALAKAKADAEKAAKAAAEAAKRNKEFMDAFGISSQQAEGLVALAKMLGKSGTDLAAEFKSYAQKAEAYGYPLNGIECATIMSYSNGTYSAVNKALRNGAWTPAQHVYVSMVNKALSKMPTYSGGGLSRGAHLSADEQKAYVEGHIIQEPALMSTSTGSGFSGNTKFKITAIGKRGASIKKLSHYPGEQEVLFQARTFFKVDKVEGTPGGPMTIHMTEWEEH